MLGHGIRHWPNNKTTLELQYVHWYLVKDTMQSYVTYWCYYFCSLSQYTESNNISLYHKSPCSASQDFCSHYMTQFNHVINSGYNKISFTIDNATMSTYGYVHSCVFLNFFEIFSKWCIVHVFLWCHTKSRFSLCWNSNHPSNAKIVKKMGILLCDVQYWSSKPIDYCFFYLLSCTDSLLKLFCSIHITINPL